MTAGNYQKFDAANVALSGVNLIEAAAGTGKTYSIAIMVLRWILETEHTIDSVLAVTFTNFATAELKERILRFLEQALDCFETGVCEDKMIRALCRKHEGSKEAAVKKLKKAVNDFDTASIFTIHGFCQKLIKEHAFELGIDFDMELSADADPEGDTALSFFRQNISECELAGGNGRRLIDEKESRDKMLPKALKDFISRVGIGVKDSGIKLDPTKFPSAGQIEEIYRNFIDQAPVIARKNRNRKNVMGFNDILLIVYEALQDGKNGTGGSLKKIMAERYSLVLIDEFQDTDPFQYYIFKELFCNGRHTVFFIGDPKQSIYAFRKADIFSYIEAKNSVGNIYNMERNFRSSPAAVGAVNEVFGKQDIFGDDSLIAYNRVSAAKSRDGYAMINGDKKLGGIIVRKMPDFEDGKDIKAGSLKNRIKADISRTIWEMTKPGSAFRIIETEDDKTSERAVRLSDIAVLVAKNDFAAEVCEKLMGDGISAVVEADTAKQLAIFASEEAAALKKLIDAAVTGGVAEFKTLLLSFFYSRALSDIADEKSGINGLHDSFISHFENWEHKGFYSVFSGFLQDGEIIRNLAAKGERTISILRQLAELIHKHELSEGNSPILTQRWFNEKMESGRSSDDEIIRTESEKTECVRIMTLHKSKGLEFNIVFFPFILSKDNKAGWVMQHSKTDNGYKKEMILTSNKGGTVRKGELPNDEALEEMRRIYVGITRAKYLTVCYTQFKKNFLEPSSLFGATDSEFIKFTGTETETEDQDPAEEKAAVPETELTPPEEIGKNIRTDWELSSFSGIISYGHSGDRFAGAKDSDPETEDTQKTKAEAPEEDTVPMAQFRKGSDAGTVLHKIFEKADFSSEDNRGIIGAILKSRMNIEEAEFDDTVSAVNECFNAVCSAPMFEGGKTLRDIPKDDMASEMEFFVTIKSDAQKGKLSKILTAKYGTAALENDDLRQGFLNGSIDLAAKIDDKYYIIDWKSNYLGETFSDYDENHMREEMKKHNYYLQFMLYLAAFDKYMKTLGKNYSYDRNFGGIRYVFLRGVKAGSSDTGIFAEKPDREMLRQIQELFGEDA